MISVPKEKYFCTLYFLGKAIQNGATHYGETIQFECSEDGIERLFKKIKSSDYMPALCRDKIGNECSRAVYGLHKDTGQIVRQTKDTKDFLSETFPAQFVETDVIVIDCDGKISIEEFKNRAKDFHYFMITTRSHGTKPGDHFRAFFPLDKKITSEEKYLSLLNKIISFFDGDKSCSDPVRMFFASLERAVYFYHPGKSILDYISKIEKVEEDLKGGERIDDPVDPKTLDYWYGMTEDEVFSRFKTIVNEGARNAHLYGACGHFIIGLDKSKEETHILIEKCNSLLPVPKNWREEKPKMVLAVEAWLKRKESLKTEKQKPENKYELDDIDLALFLAEQLESTFRWCEEHNIWYYFENGKWIKDNGLVVYEATKRAMRKRIEIGRRKIKELKSKVERAKYWKELKGLLTHHKRMTILKDTRSLLAILAKEFDAHDNLLNLKNGTLDLNTYLFKNHSPEEYHTKAVDCSYIEDAKTPEIFLQFIDEIFEGKKDIVDYVQKILGYSLSGDIGQQEFYILHGDGQNGKSQLILVFGEIMADYVHTTDAEKLMANPYTNKDTYLAMFKNIRALFCFEGKDDDKLNVPLIKLLTGGESLTVAQKYEKPETFKLKLKPFLITNPKPETNDSSFALWRRIRLIPFLYTVPEDKRIKDFYKILLDAGRPGIFNWFLEGWKRYKAEGLKPPDEVKMVTDEYQKEMDELQIFLDEQCIVQADARIQSSSFYNAYFKWSHKPKYLKLSQRKFSREIEKKGFLKVCGERGCRYFAGIQLIDGEDKSNPFDNK